MKKNTFLNYVLNILPLLLVGGALVYAAAPAGGYLPGATNDPDCVPGATNCFVKVVTTQGSEYGDIKQGIQSSDHNGWIKLDGRAMSTLTSTQQSQATALGIGANLPDATNAYLSQNGSTLGAVGGSNTKIIAQNQLPNITLNGTTASAGAHTHTYTDYYYAENAGANWGWAGSTNGYDNDNRGFSTAGTTASAGAHTHSFTTSSLNGGVTQQVLNVQPQTMSVNIFIYLGQ